ncbi:hypothetical protein ACJX0J_039338 [Zea mays]
MNIVLVNLAMHALGFAGLILKMGMSSIGSFNQETKCGFLLLHFSTSIVLFHNKILPFGGGEGGIVQTKATLVQKLQATLGTASMCISFMLIQLQALDKDDPDVQNSKH